MSDYDMVCPRCGRFGLIHALADQCYACDDEDNESKLEKEIVK